MPNIRDMAYTVEAVKVALRQTKDGVMITLSIHPNDVPKDLLADPVGSRYTVAMVRRDDDESPVMPPEKAKGEKMVAQAHMLCRNEKFWRWFTLEVDTPPVVSEEECAWLLREALGISSRGDLREDSRAQARFQSYVDGFSRSLSSGANGPT